MAELAGQHAAIAVVVPLIAAPLCALLTSARLAWWLAMAASAVSLVAVSLLAADVLGAGELVYPIGGWAAPWGIEYRIDSLGALVLLVVAGISTLVLPFARLSVAQEVSESRHSLFYTAWLLNLTGMLGIVMTGDAFNAFVFLEIASLSSYVLVSFGRERRALVAAYRYLVLGTVGATFFLIGVGLLYAMTGTLNMADLAERIVPLRDTATVRAAFVFIIVGLALKSAVFPLHAWLPNAYAFAPSAVSAFFAGTSTKVALYLLLRFVFTLFGVDLGLEGMQFDAVALPLAMAAMLAASAVAVYQSDVKRLLAYSSIAQVGYIILGVGLGTKLGIAAAVIHIFNHAITKTALFMAIGCTAYRTGSTSIDSLAGLGRRMPWTMAAMTLGGLGLIGVPLTAGFVSKWYLVLAVLERGWWPVAVVVLVSSLLAVVYMGRILEAAYFREPGEHSLQATTHEVPASMVLPLWVLVLATVYFGVFTELGTSLAGRAASALMGVAQ